MGKKIRAYICGAGTVMAIMPRHRHVRFERILPKSDAEALREDWYTVGDDFYAAMATVARDRKMHVETVQANP